MKNKIVATIITIALSASLGAGAVAIGSHFVTKLPASKCSSRTDDRSQSRRDKD